MRHLSDMRVRPRWMSPSHTGTQNGSFFRQTNALVVACRSSGFPDRKTETDGSRLTMAVVSLCTRPLPSSIASCAQLFLFRVRYVCSVNVYNFCWARNGVFVEKNECWQTCSALGACRALPCGDHPRICCKQDHQQRHKAAVSLVYY